jgi:hypothetical protein
VAVFWASPESRSRGPSDPSATREVSGGLRVDAASQASRNPLAQMAKTGQTTTRHASNSRNRGTSDICTVLIQSVQTISRLKTQIVGHTCANALVYRTMNCSVARGNNSQQKRASCMHHKIFSSLACVHITASASFSLRIALSRAYTPPLSHVSRSRSLVVTPFGKSNVSSATTKISYTGWS